MNRRCGLRIRRRFYDGPALFNHPGRRMREYRSPNLLVAQWIRAFSVSYLTPAGSVLIVIIFAFALSALTTLLMPICFLSFTLMSLFIVAVVVGWIFRPQLAIERLAPESACCR